MAELNVADIVQEMGIEEPAEGRNQLTRPRQTAHRN